MNSVSASTGLLFVQKRSYNSFSSEYKVDMWQELGKRWMVLGVLTSVMLAVVSPKFGSTAGPLHTDYLSYLPLTYIYYTSGRHSQPIRTLLRQRKRLILVTVLHAHVVAPVICFFIANMCYMLDMDHRIIDGAIFASVGGGCAWLSLAMSRGAAPEVFASCLVAALAAPLAASAELLQYSPYTIPTLHGLLPLIAILLSLTLPACERTEHAREHSEFECTRECSRRYVVARLCALVLLYVECCNKIWEAEGSLYVGDVFTTLTLELTYVTLSGLACVLYSRCGVMCEDYERALVASAVPKDLDTVWHRSQTGLSRLPRVFLAPAQALLVAALAQEHHYSTDEDDTLTYSNGYQGLPR